MTFGDLPRAPGPAAGIIYARSAYRKQRNDDALEFQISRSRSLAKRLGLEIKAVFTDYGSGDVAVLSGMVNMLSFLRLAQPTRHVVIVDDISRLGREIEAHASLCRKLEEAGAELLTPGFAFGADSDRVFIDNILTAMAQFERDNNRLRVIARQKAKMKERMARE